MRTLDQNRKCKSQLVLPAQSTPVLGLRRWAYSWKQTREGTKVARVCDTRAQQSRQKSCLRPGGGVDGKLATFDLAVA